ncbi:MAG TPA: dTDP-4-dehydrorhamnose reductase, partial [Archaeoglobaceae archaeon]|nr:dTDP-4-dehydrorhamnose reductase [Archaeoglobaceae archaeon]
FFSHKPDFGEPIKFNLLDKELINREMKRIQPDVVLHTAALTDVDGCEREKELAFRINVEGARAVAYAVKEIGSFLIYASTDYVFDGRRGFYREYDETNPINYYGYTKLRGEEYCRDFCIARTCVIYGAKPASGKTNFALWLVNSLQNGKEVRVVTDQFVTPTLNTNLAEMTLEIAEKGIRGIFHLAGATRVSRFEFAQALADIFGFDRELIIPSSMKDMKWIAERPADSSLNTSKASDLLQNKPYNLEKALRTLKEEIEADN